MRWKNGDKKMICTECKTEKEKFCKGMCKRCYNKIWLQSNRDNSPLILCACNCGTMIHSIGSDGQPRRYKRGHNYKGENNPAYKGGRIINDYGYARLWIPGHVHSNKHNYVREHVFVYTEFHKCCMLPWGAVHHKDENKLNNNINNLQGVTLAQHFRIHRTKDMDNRHCKICLSDKTFIRKSDGRPSWNGNDRSGFICHKCKCKMNHERRKIRLEVV